MPSTLNDGMWVDAHCHLDQVPEPEKAVALAEEAGVKAIISNSESLASCQANLALAEKLKPVKACLGLHPVQVLSLSGPELAQALKEVERLLPSALGVGETGLDFKHAQTESQKRLQLQAFQAMASMALAAGKPVQVHSRQAQRECLAALSSLKAEKVLMHWFVAKKALLDKALDLGYFVSLGPSLLFQDGLTSYARKLPLESLLLETDCPVPFNGRPSRPAWVKDVALKLADLKELPLKELERALEKNARSLFGRL